MKQNRILIIYAYPKEVESLKKMVLKAPFSARINWFRFSSKTAIDQLEKEISSTRPDLIINAGFAGALNKNLSLGTVFLINKVGNQNLRFSCSIALSDLFVATLTTVDKPIMETSTDNSPPADLVDMEASHILALANKLNIDFLSFKVVSDYADTSTWTTINAQKTHFAELLGKTVTAFLKNILTS